MLNNTQLGPNHITVTSASGDSSDDAAPPSPADRDADEITQEEKPRSRIIAEYLAHGYVVGDAAITRAIQLDHQHGVSTRFFNKLTELDGKYHATDRARTADQSYGITQRANTLFTGLNSYFEKATNTPTGKKLVDFCEWSQTPPPPHHFKALFCGINDIGQTLTVISTDNQGQKQLVDVHNEARRLAELKKDEHGGSAYKASGLERVFGAEKTGTQTEAPASGPGAPTAGASTTTETTQPAKPAEGGVGVQESEKIPQ